MPIKTGAAVRQIVPAPIEGIVTVRRFNDSYDQMEYLLACVDGEARWFLESQIEETKGEAA